MINKEDTDSHSLEEDNALLAAPTEEPGQVSTLSAFLVLLKAIVCSGVLVLPQSFRQGGSLLGSLVFVIIGFLTGYGFILLVDCKNKVGGTFGEIGTFAYGKVALYAVEVSLVISQLGFCSTYLIFVADLAERFFGLWIFKCSLEWRSFPYFGLVAIQFFILLPLLFIRKIKVLAIPSLFANACIVFSLGTVVYYAIRTIVDSGVQPIALATPSFPIFIGTAVFAYEGIAMILPLEESMQTKSHFNKLIIGTLSLITVFFIAFCVIGNMAWGEKLETIILENMPQDTWFPQIIIVLYICAVILSFPVQFYPAIIILEAKANKFVEKYIGRPVSEKMGSMMIFWLENLGRAVLLLVLISISILGSSQLDSFVSLVGAVCCIPLAFIYPAIFHYKLVAESTFHRVTDMAMVVFGVFSMLGSAALVLYQWITRDHSHHNPCANFTTNITDF